MPVPNTMADLATLASSNYPTGTESIGNSLDDYLRSHAAIIRSTNAIASSTIASASTTNLASADGESVVVTGTTTINNFGTGFVGCRREVAFQSSLTIVNSANIVLPDNVNLAVAAGDRYSFRCVSAGVWALTGGTKDMQAVRRTGDTMTGRLTLSGSADLLTTAVQANTEGPLYVKGSGASGSIIFQPQGTATAQGRMDSGGNLIIPGDIRPGAAVQPSASSILYLKGSTGSGQLIFQPLGNSTNQGSYDSSGNLSAAGNIISNSDESLKKDWVALPTDLVDRFAAMTKVGGYTRIDTGVKQVGVGAGDLETFLPLAVMTNENGLKSVAYGNAALVGVVALCRRLVALERRLAA